MYSLRSRGLRREIRQAIPLNAVVQIRPTTRFRTASRWRHLKTCIPQALELAYPTARLVEGASAPPRAWSVSGARTERAAVVCCFMTQWAATRQSTNMESPARRRSSSVLEAATPQTRRAELEVRRYLFVGRGWDRKNGDAVVEAFIRIRELLPAATPRSCWRPSTHQRTGYPLSRPSLACK